MRLYQTARGHFAGTRKLAETVAHRDGSGKGNWRQVDVPTDKPGLINWLNKRAEDRNANEAIESAPPAPPIAAAPMTEDSFEALPLAQQLHLAALAVENAREQIKPC